MKLMVDTSDITEEEVKESETATVSLKFIAIMGSPASTNSL
jgi:hypothetical protein